MSCALLDLKASATQEGNSKGFESNRGILYCLGPLFARVALLIRKQIGKTSGRKDRGPDQRFTIGFHWGKKAESSQDLHPSGENGGREVCFSGLFHSSYQSR